MYLLYLDDSGSVANANEDFVVLGGICVHETQINYFTNGLDDLARQLNPADPDTVEFHASEVFSGRMAPWNALDRDQRRNVIKDGSSD